jgi:hypothetical protein
LAQSTAGTSLVANYAAPSRVAARTVEVCWDGTNWVDETSRVQSLHIRHQLLNEALGLPMLGQGLASDATVTLDNRDGRYSPALAGSMAHTYRPDGLYRVPIRISMGYSGEVLRQFTGEIIEAPGSERLGRRTVTLRCQDYSFALMQIKHKSALSLDDRPDEVMAALLDVADAADPLFAAHTSRALDYALSVIPYVWQDEDNLWEELGYLAASEAGMIHFSKEGAFRFWRQTAFVERAHSLASQVTLDRSKATEIGDDASWRNAYTKVIVEASPWQYGPLVVAYQAQAEIVVEPGQTVTHYARYSHPMLWVQPPVEGDDYRAVNAGMSDLSGDLTVGITSYAQQAEITLTNASASQAIYVVGLQVRGYPLEARADDKVEFETTLTPPKVPGVKEYVVPQNDWLQTRYQAELVGTRLRDLLQRPRRLYAWVGPLCPWLELGDRVTLVDATTGLNEAMLVMALEISAGATDQTMALTLLPVADLYPHTSYFRWGVSSYANSGSARSYY